MPKSYSTILRARLAAALRARGETPWTIAARAGRSHAYFLRKLEPGAGKDAARPLVATDVDALLAALGLEATALDGPVVTAEALEILRGAGGKRGLREETLDPATTPTVLGLEAQDLLERRGAALHLTALGRRVVDGDFPIFASV